jgi:hypothetical protein
MFVSSFSFTSYPNFWCLPYSFYLKFQGSPLLEQIKKKFYLGTKLGGISLLSYIHHICQSVCMSVTVIFVCTFPKVLDRFQWEFHLIHIIANQGSCAPNYAPAI